MSKAVQGQGMHRDSLRGGGAGIPIFAYRRHGRLHGQGACVHGHQGRVPNVSSVAEEVTLASTGTSGRTSGRTSGKKLGRGSLGRKAGPPKMTRRKGEWDPKPAAAALRAAAAAAARPRPPEGDREVKPQVRGCEDKREDEWDVICKCR
jgi:hypothetical protein